MMTGHPASNAVMRKTVLLWLLALGFGTANCQVRLGIVGGLHSANILETNRLPGWDTAVHQYLTPKSGFELGFILEVPLGSGFYFQPALSYITKGRQYSRTNDSISALNSDTIYNKFSVNLSYIEIPLDLTYKIALTHNGRNSFTVSAGPYVGFFYSGNTTTSSLTSSPTEQVNSETDPVSVGKAPGAFKTLDIGVNGKAGFELGNLLLNVYYSRGLTNMYTADYPGTFHNTVFGGSIGIWLTGSGTPPPVRKRDTDKDGIPDAEDACPLQPGVAKYHGCPIPDRDGDGLNDEADACPDVAGPPFNHGCPLQTPAVVVARPMVAADSPVAPVIAMISHEDSLAIDFIAHNVLFNSSSDQFRDSSYAALDSLAARLLAHPAWHLTIEGHTDSSGIPAKNRLLSQRRADAIRSYLLTKGVTPDRLTAIGYGSTRPVADNRTVAGRAANRRVELKLSIGTP